MIRRVKFVVVLKAGYSVFAQAGPSLAMPLRVEYSMLGAILLLGGNDGEWYTLYLFANIDEGCIGELMLEYVNSQAIRTSRGMRTTILEQVTPQELWDMGLGLRVGFYCRRCGASSKRMQACGGCRFAKYCSPECQKGDWKRHKRICNSGFKNSKQAFPRPSDTYWGIVSGYTANMIEHIAPLYAEDPITGIEFTDAISVDWTKGKKGQYSIGHPSV